MNQSMVGDGSGSSLDVWVDYRSGNLDIYAQKLNPAGTGSWIKDGMPVCKDVANQTSPKAVSDGSGGLIVVWEDARPGTNKDIYAQRSTPSGRRCGPAMAWWSATRPAISWRRFS